MSNPLVHEWRTCPDCEAPFRPRPLAPGHQLRCKRCGARLGQGRKSDSLQTPMALAVTGSTLLLLANVFPVMTFDVAGRTQSNLIITGISGLFDQGYGPLAVLVFFCAIGAPAIYLGLLCYTLSATMMRARVPGLQRAWHWVELAEPWSLIPVFAVACLVAVVRLDLLGTVTWGNGAVFVVLLALCCLLLGRMLDRERIDMLREELS
ncbi:MAG: paraquat-inducible protein A [Chthoniobacterales bacterium]|jgi:paraquat-inducible protein A